MVFDSGIGGTTVLEHIQKRIPDAQYSYFMDNALLPYGAQTQQTIIGRLCSLIYFIEQNALNVDLIVIACNTASFWAIKLFIPFVSPSLAFFASARIFSIFSSGFFFSYNTVQMRYFIGQM